MTPALPIVLIVLFAQMVEALAGFGSTVLALTLGANWMPIDRFIPILIPVSLVLSAYLTLRYRNRIRYRLLLGRIIPLTVLGMPLGYLFFGRLSGEGMKTIFGLFVLAFSLAELARSLHSDPSADGVATPSLRRFTWLWLVAGGVVHGLYASGGPLIVYYVGRTGMKKAEFRSTLSALWLVLNLVLLSAHWTAGRINVATLIWSAGLLLPLAAGIAGGEWLHHRISEQRFRTLVFLLLAFAGAVLAIPKG